MMREERYFINETHTIDIRIEEVFTNPYLLSVKTTIVILWMYFILSLEHHIDFILRLFGFNHFIL